jgi:hypothetical protein
MAPVGTTDAIEMIIADAGESGVLGHQLWMI